MKMIITLFFFFCVPSFAFNDGAYVFNVGHGNFSIVRYNNSAVIIDCGSGRYPQNEQIGSNYIQDYVLPYANALLSGIQPENCAIFITHHHADHYNKVNLLTNIQNVHTRYIGHNINCSISNQEYSAIRKAQKYSVGDIEVSVLPSGGTSGNKHNIMVKVTAGGNQYLFTGDADGNGQCQTFDTEYDIVEAAENVQDSSYGMKIDANTQTDPSSFCSNISLFVAPHHGSITHNADTWLKKIKPLPITIISCKAGAYNNMPNKYYFDCYQREARDNLHPFSYADGRKSVVQGMTKGRLYSTHDLFNTTSFCVTNNPVSGTYVGYRVGS